MEMTQYLDGYCERLDPGYWAEPVNAVTNGAFLLAAAICWGRSAEVPMARAMCIALALIGTGSFLFHTHAQVWAAIADVAPIVGFILLYIYAANRQFWSMSIGVAGIATLGFLPFAGALVPLAQLVPFVEISAGYWPVPLFIGIYAVLLRKRSPATARGLAIGAGLLCLSLILRSLDLILCPSVPLGTHFAWHLLNAVMLGWMIEVYRRHVVAGKVARG